MTDTLNYSSIEFLLGGIDLLLSKGVRQFTVAFHQPSGSWAISFPPQAEPIYDEFAEAQPDS